MIAWDVGRIRMEAAEWGGLRTPRAPRGAGLKRPMRVASQPADTHPEPIDHYQQESN